MQLYTTIPLEIRILSYTPKDPGRLSGRPEDCYPPEASGIEVEVRTLSGIELSESDLGAGAWEELYSEVLLTREADIKSVAEEAKIDAWENRWEVGTYW